MEDEKGRSAEAMEVEDAGGGPAGHGGVWGLLSLARQLVSEGKPSLALKAVVMAMKSEGGEQAVYETLHRARELYRNRLQANAAADELASLFAECAIAEAQPVTSDPPSTTEIDPSVLLPDSAENSILAISGRKQIMLDAFSDGSSFICLQCGGLVSNLRREEHVAYWCG
ncbi:hypothetical protein J5N97_002715 [Dioscorea zingiberensis]|uniref:C2HC zinc finger plants domain-containing protein n=1 Tax=Dioscorea zingiberensis TaxID=325984 RepID=A0A9D5D483_9LILI|nr:hypothetical protein J5N97_002715 [Dioscorea zingiberensis]